MNKVFLHNDGRLRSTLQILIASCTFLFISMFGQGFVGKMIYSLTQSQVLPETIYESYFLTGTLPEVFLNFFAGACILLLYRCISKKSLANMGVPAITKNVKTIAAGVLTMLVVLSVITGVLFVTGNIKFTGIEFHWSLLQYILLMASVSFVEEVLNRGFIQHLVAGRATTVWSLVIPSFVFMLFHVQNPDMTPLGLINIFLAGFFFSVATYKVGNIWFAFGAHIVWNVGLACVFGLMGVSSVTGSVLNFTYEKSNIFNGYGVSPLYGLIGTVTWIVLITIFFVFQRNRGILERIEKDFK